MVQWCRIRGEKGALCQHINFRTEELWGREDYIQRTVENIDVHCSFLQELLSQLALGQDRTNGWYMDYHHKHHKYPSHLCCCHGRTQDAASAPFPLRAFLYYGHRRGLEHNLIGKNICQYAHKCAFSEFLLSTINFSLTSVFYNTLGIPTSELLLSIHVFID